MDFIRCDVCNLAYEQREIHQSRAGSFCQDCHRELLRQKDDGERMTGKSHPLKVWWKWFRQDPACPTETE